MVVTNNNAECPGGQTRADLGVGPGGAGHPFVQDFFSFVNVCRMVLRALLLQYIFSLINLAKEKIYRALSLPGGCALAAIASAPASIIKCYTSSTTTTPVVY